MAEAVSAPVSTLGENAQVLVLPGELTHSQAQTCLRMLTQGLGRGKEPVVADATALTRFDSSALAVLLACRREVLSLGRSFMVRGLHPRLAGLAGLYGVTALLPATA
ncbi:STAS domain-containing protein [Xylophilus sp. Kf1]|nr:STAS domain-containing protein [Xylophilus sp. Kf1]